MRVPEAEAERLPANPPEEPGLDLDRLRKQDPQAFAGLVNAHQTLVLGLCQTLGMRGADADDAAAEAFAAVYRALPRFEGRAQLTTWVYRISYRAIVRQRQKMRRGQAAGGEDYDPTAESADERLSGPAAAAESAETRQRLWAAVEKLEPRQAAAVELFYRREWPIEQIAAALECPEGTIKTLLFRARLQLKKSLERQEIGP